MSNIENNQNEIEAFENKEKINDKNSKKALLSFEYDIKNDEEGQAFLLFQKKYVYKKNWIKTIAFAVIAILFIISIGRNPEQPMNYILAAICIAAVFIIWSNTKKIRSSLLDALKLIEDDRYIFTLYDDSFSIETILAENVDENGEEIPPVEPRIVNFNDILINIIETEDMFVMILKKDTIYVLPKRCMTQEQVNILQNTFLDKLKDNYEKYEGKQ